MSADLPTDDVEINRRLEQFDQRARRIRRLGLIFSVLPLVLAVVTIFMLRSAILKKADELAQKGREVHNIEATRDGLLQNLRSVTALRNEAIRDLDEARQRRDSLQQQNDEASVALNQMNQELGRLTQMYQSTTPATATQLRHQIRGVINQDIQNGSSNRAEARRLWNDGWALFNQGNLSAARDKYTSSSRADPTYAPPLNSLGRLAETAGDHASAVRFYEQAVRLDGDYVPALDNLARARLEAGRVTEARTLITHALEVRPHHELSEALLRDINQASNR